MARFVFVTGGVVSSLGKGLTSAALGALLQARGYSVRLRKLDPYLNVDPGTMSPYEHGEVFVTDDGAETDLDLGHYERFTGVAARCTDSISAGRIYQNVLVLDFKSLYPSIVRTFFIDPLGLAEPGENPLPGFLGAEFSREQHILPGLIEELWSARDEAKRERNAPPRDPRPDHGDSERQRELRSHQRRRGDGDRQRP